MKEEFIEDLSLTPIFPSAMLRLQSQDAVQYPALNTSRKEISATLFIKYPLKDDWFFSLVYGIAYEKPMTVNEIMQDLERATSIVESLKEKVEDRVAYYTIKFSYQSKYVLDVLRKDPWSDGALIEFSHPEADPVQTMQFFIRDGRLHCKCQFPSANIYDGLYIEIKALIGIQRMLAEILEVPVGSYTQRINNLYCLKKDFDRLDKERKDMDTRIRTMLLGYCESIPKKKGDHNEGMPGTGSNPS